MATHTASSKSIPWMFAGLENGQITVVTPPKGVAPSKKTVSRTDLQVCTTTANETGYENKINKNNFESGKSHKDLPWMFRDISQDNRWVMSSYGNERDKTNDDDECKEEAKEEEEPINIMRNISNTSIRSSNNSNRSSASNYNYEIATPAMRRLSNGGFNRRRLSNGRFSVQTNEAWISGNSPWVGLKSFYQSSLEREQQHHQQEGSGGSAGGEVKRQCLFNGGFSVQTDGAWISGNSPWVGLQPFYQSSPEHEQQQQEERSGESARGEIRRQCSHEDDKKDLYYRFSTNSIQHRADEFRKALVPMLPMDVITVDLSFRFEDDNVSALGHDTEPEQLVTGGNTTPLATTTDPPTTQVVSAAVCNDDSLSHLVEDGSSVLFSAAPKLAEADEDEDDDDYDYQTF